MPVRGSLVKGIVLLGLSAAFMGCPSGPSSPQPALLVSPTSLDFGLQGDAPQTFTVKANTETPALPAFTLSASAGDEEWLLPTPAQAISAGPDDVITCEVRVDRTKLRAGQNQGTVNVTCPGLVPRAVTVTAESLMAADFTAEPKEIFEDESVQFTDGSAVAAGQAAINRWVWNFGDGTPPVTFNTPTDPEHVYATPSPEGQPYTVTLTTYTMSGNTVVRQDTETQEMLITVNEKVAPTAAFSVSSTSPQANASITFTDKSTDGTAKIDSWLWNFGDGQTSTLKNPTHAYQNGGNYTVSLTVASPHGSDIETKSNYIQVIAVAPNAAFSVPAGALFAGAPIQFTDLSTPGTSPITSWTWDFGDGSQTNGTNPVHTYEDGGDYTVTLSVVTNHGTDSFTDIVGVEERAPTANFTVNDSKPLVNTAVQFTDTSLPGTSPITAWAWNFGDGATSNLQNPSHTYTKPGFYTVSLQVTSDHGTNTKSVPSFMEIRTEAPTADFSIAPQTQYVGHVVQFTDNSINGTSTIINRAWNFGDGSPISNAVNPVHSYATAKDSYIVTLTVTTAHGTNSVSKPVKIIPAVAPTAEFVANKLKPYEADPVTFTDQSTEGSSPITSWLWNFGDNTTSTERNPQHIYNQPGVFSVSLTVTTQDGSNTKVRTDYISVKPNIDPTAGFSADKTEVEVGGTVRFTDQSTSGTATISSRLWSFGDPYATPADNSSSETNPSHVYTQPGRYTVTLQVTSPHGQDTETKTNYILVRAKVDFEATPTAAIVGKAVKFTDKTAHGTMPIVSWQWNFGDGLSGTDQSPSHTYGLTGTFDVTLTVTLENGTTASLTKTAYITTTTAGPTASFNVSNFQPYMWETVNFTDTSDPGSAAILSWQWTLGDNAASSARHPSIIYTAAGEKTITLTVTTAFGSSSATKIILVDTPNVTARFTQDKAIVLRSDDLMWDGTPVNDAPTFTSTSSMVGTGGLTLSYGWRVWQGDPGAVPGISEHRGYGSVWSPAQFDEYRDYWSNPFNEAGLYHVNLAVTGDVIVNPNNPDDPRNLYSVIGGGVTKANAVEVREPGDLDMYVRKADASYAHTLRRTLQGTGYKAFVVELVSQSWKAPNQASPRPWRHWLTIIQPADIGYDTGLLYLTESTTNNAMPTSVDPDLAQFAVDTRTVVGILDNVPNLPAGYNTPDELIAASMAAFATDENALPETLAQFAMTKSVSKAMDTIQWLLANPQLSGNYPPVIVPGFVVAGGSEDSWARAWAVWLTAIADFRVKGIIPIGFDGLYIYFQFWHQYETLGHVPEALQPYYDNGALFLSHPEIMEYPLFIRELRRRVERVMRQIMHDWHDDFFVAPQRGNNFDHVNALKDMLYKKDDDSSWQIAGRLAGYAGNESYFHIPLTEAADYAQKLYDTLKFYTENGGTLTDSDAKKLDIARYVAGPDYPLYTYRADIPNLVLPPEDTTGVELGKASKLTSLMKIAETAAIRSSFYRDAWMQMMVDPVFYNDPFNIYTNFSSPYGNRLQIPKYVLNSTGDTFTAPDSSTFYFDMLSEQKYLRYFPNTDRTLGGYKNVLLEVKPWYQNLVAGINQPRFNWEFLSDEQLIVRVLDNPTPDRMPALTLWQAVSDDGLDFRVDPDVNPNPPVWTSRALTLGANNTVYVQVFPSLNDFTAYFVELTYPPEVEGDAPLKFTTNIRILGPYESPYENQKSRPDGVIVAGENPAPAEEPAP